MSTFTQRLHCHLERTPERIAVILQQAGQPDRSIPYHEFIEEEDTKLPYLFGYVAASSQITN